MKQAQKQGEKNKIGAIGEKIATNYLKKQGFKILDENYLKKWGEIDIVACLPSRQAHETNKVHFIEVKTVSYETKVDLNKAISRGTWRPEENVHKNKLKRLNRAIESWLSENKYESNWVIDVIAVRIVTREKYATVKYLQNIILD